MEEILDFIKTHSRDGLLEWDQEIKAVKAFPISHREVELAALSVGIMPGRYARNRDTICIKDQETLLKSRAAIIGCGGLGGYIVEALARLGIGGMIIVDPDTFEGHNLNRQLLCTTDVMGMNKAKTAMARVKEINPAVEVKVFTEAFSKDRGREMLEGADVALDGLDNIRIKIELGRICNDMKIPLVHGSVGGWYGQVATQMPGDNTIEKIYENFGLESGIEKTLGNLAFTPSLIASVQAGEACKIILGRDSILKREILFFNMLDPEIERFRL